MALMDFPHDEKWQQRLEKTAQKLTQVSPTFCAAKWSQVTLHLQNGLTHSCHHPRPHQVPLEELASSADALHNTKHKILQREQMRAGQRPSECEFCWKAEDASQTTWSDRVIKSADSWAPTDFSSLAATERPHPTYLEVSFSHACNLRCMYCSPEISSAIWGEYEKHGPYPVGGSHPLEWYQENNRRPYRVSDQNPYVDAFEVWFPQVLPGLRVFRITGGEPLLSPQTFKTLDFLRRGSFPELSISVNSNLMVPPQTLERLAEALEDLAVNRKVKEVRLYTSVDAHGAQANWIRHGMDYKVLMKQSHRFLKLAPHVSLTFIATHNVFSFSSFGLLLADILDLKRAHIREARTEPRVMVDITQLRNPSYLSSLIAPDHLRQLARYSYDFMERNAESLRMPWGFNRYERNKMQRLWEILEKGPQGEEAQQLDANRYELRRFVEEYVKRKGTHYSGIFPDYCEFLSWEQSR